MRTIGVVGYGSFGKLIVKFLTKLKVNILVYDKSDYVKSLIKEDNLINATLSDIGQCDIIILSIPSTSLKKFVKSIKTIIKPNTIIIDTCSVKSKPEKIIKKHLTNRYIGLHPLFGPQSYGNSNRTYKIVMCNKSIWLKTFLLYNGFDVIEMDSDEHDKQMSYVQVIPHLISDILRNFDIKDFDTSTSAYNHLLSLHNLLKNDSVDLYETIMCDNPYAQKQINKFKKIINKL